MKRCINVDWLEVYCLEPPDNWPLNADYFRGRGYQVVERDYGTRVYAEMFTILDQWGDGFIEVRRNPLANTMRNERSFLEPYAAHIRLRNKWCYCDNAVAVMQEFLLTHDYALKSIYRIDICLDFEKFDMGDMPADFMRRYMAGKFTKINQSSIMAHGSDTWDGRTWNSVTWGSRTSMIGTKFYNKTLELASVSDKPYIRYAWRDAGLVDDPVSLLKFRPDGSYYKPELWRVEFSIKSSAAKWYIVEDYNGKKKRRISYPHTLDLYADRGKLLFVFASLCHYYFHFKHFEHGVRKDRCKDKILFRVPTADAVYRPVTLASEKSSERNKIMRMIHRLRMFQMSVIDPGVYRAVNNIIDYLDGRVIAAEVRDVNEIAEIRRVHALFSQPVENITEAEVIALDKRIAEALMLDFGGADAPPENNGHVT